MLVRDILWACAEMSTAEHHDKTWTEQITTPGEKARLVALARCMPSSLVSRLVSWKKVDTTPIRSDAYISERPIGYGGESLVYGLEHGQERKVFKLEHSKFPPEQQLDMFISHYRLYRHYFGDLVVPASYMICESPYGSGTPVVASIQPRIEGVSISEVNTEVNQADLDGVLSGAARMIDEQGKAPDFGLTNLRVNESGRIHIIDTGYVIPMAELDSVAYGETISYLESLRVSELQLAS